MSKVLLKMTLALLVSVSYGCVSDQYRKRDEETLKITLNRLEESKQHSTYSCPNKPTCDKAFSLTKIYIQNNSDMKIQFSDDTIVSTYNPTTFGSIGMSATKTPGRGDSATIQLNVFCKFSIADIDCLRRSTDAYAGFRNFLESGVK